LVIAACLSVCLSTMPLVGGDFNWHRPVPLRVEIMEHSYLWTEASYQILHHLHTVTSINLWNQSDAHARIGSSICRRKETRKLIQRLCKMPYVNEIENTTRNAFSRSLTRVQLRKIDRPLTLRLYSSIIFEQ